MNMPLSRRMMHGAMLGTIVALSTGCASTPTSESTGQYMDNSVLTSKVKTALTKADAGDLVPISVESYKGVVQLSGFVDSQEKVRQAGEIAASISGVKSVENSLTVKLGGWQGRPPQN